MIDVALRIYKILRPTVADDLVVNDNRSDSQLEGYSSFAVGEMSWCVVFIHESCCYAQSYRGGELEGGLDSEGDRPLPMRDFEVVDAPLSINLVRIG